MFEYVKLKELCTVNQGLQIPISKRLKEAGPNRYFYITVQFLKNNIENYYIDNPPIATTCNKEEILMVRTGNTGQVITGVEGCFHNNFFKVKPNDRIIPKYMYYVLKSDLMYKRILNAASGTTIPDLKHSSFYELDIPLPTIEIQKKISEMLESIDKKIDNNSAINRNLSEQAASVFSEWLTICDKEITIGEIADNIIDYNVGNHEKVVLINSSDVTEGYFDHHVVSDNIDLKGHFKKAFKKWDILYSEIRPRNKHYAYCQFDPEGYIASTRLMIIRNKPNMISSSMLYQYLMLRDVFEEFTLKTESRSGTFPQGRYEDMASIKVPYSDVIQQEKVSKIIDDYYAVLWKNDIENRRLSELRDALLPKLMSGELDLTNLDI